MEPSHSDRLWIEGDEPCKCADLRRNVSDLSCDARCSAKILWAMRGNATQQKRNHSKSWCGASSRREQTRKSGFVGALPFLSSGCNVPTARLKLGAWRSETVCYLLP